MAQILVMFFVVYIWVMVMKSEKDEFGDNTDFSCICSACQIISNIFDN